MALSNWDLLAFDLDGPCHGSLVNHAGVTVEIYKNWLYLHDRGKGDGPSPYTGDVVGEVHAGTLQLGYWDIRARRGPQDGVYVVAWSAHWVGPDHGVGASEGWNDDSVVGRADKALLVGCGVAGYSDEIEPFAEQIVASGADPDSLAVVTTWTADGEAMRCLEGMIDEKFVVIAVDVPEAEFVGVLPSSVDFLRAMVDEVIDEHRYGDWPTDALRALPWDDAVRANQGDMFFVGGEATTRPGEADTPILGKLLKADTDPD